jgi:hypothetical protein
MRSVSPLCQAGLSRKTQGADMPWTPSHVQRSRNEFEISVLSGKRHWVFKKVSQCVMVVTALRQQRGPA